MPDTQSSALLVSGQRNLTADERMKIGPWAGNVGGLEFVQSGTTASGIVHSGEDAGSDTVISGGYVGFDPAHAPDGISGGYQNLYGSGGDFQRQQYIKPASGATKLFDKVVETGVVAAFGYVAGGATGLIDAPVSPAAESTADSALSVQGNSINVLDRATGVAYGSEANAAVTGVSSAGGITLQSVGSALSTAKTAAGILGTVGGLAQGHASSPFTSGAVSTPSRSGSTSGAGTSDTAAQDFRRAEITAQNDGQGAVTQGQESLVPLYVAIGAALVAAFFLRG